MKRQLHLNLFIHSRGHHEAAWRHPDSSPLPLTDIRYYTDLAQRAEAARFPFIDADTGKPANFGMGSIAWNAYRKRWIMIAGAWGDVYYSEAARPEGPWNCAKKIVRHENYNFYNVTHHPFFDKDGGRVIYFEGTYSADFITHQAQPTPVYDYNQIMYSLSLDDPRLALPAACVDRK